MNHLHPIPGAAERAFRRGLERLRNRSYGEAAWYFHAAKELCRVEKNPEPHMKCASYLGLAMTLAHGRSATAVRLCQVAARRNFFDPDLFCNLGIVYLRNQQRGPAFRAFQQGLRLKPNHQRILQELRRYRRRRQPFFRSLPRGHSINRLAGLLRARLSNLFEAACEDGA